MIAWNRIIYFKVICLFLCVISSIEVFSIIKCYHFPFELDLIISSYQQSHLTVKEKNELHQIVVNIEAKLLKMSKVNQLFLIKSNLYKEILDYETYNEGVLIIKRKDIIKLEKKFNKYDTRYSKFSQWLIQIILSDLKRLANLSNNFKNGKTLRKVAAQVRYLLPWYNKIMQSDVVTINNLSKKIMIKFLKKLSHYFDFFLNMTPVHLDTVSENENKKSYCNYSVEDKHSSKLENAEGNLDEMGKTREMEAKQLIKNISAP